MLSRLKRAAKANPVIVRAVRSTYPALSWVSNRPTIYTRVAPYLAEMEFDEVRLAGRGNEPEALLRRTARLMPLQGSDVLVLGVGSGEELALWQKQRPRSLTATDYFTHPQSWRAFDATRFAQADVRRLPFADASFDFIASTALLEHVDGVEVLCDEMARVLRPGGLVFANFGPLYETHGGAHYGGAYEHLRMSDEDFERYLLQRAIPAELEDGLVWLRNGMFSRVRYDEYLAIFKVRFDLEHVTLGVSADGLRYRRTHRDTWHELVRDHAERDLLTFSMTVWMRPKPPALASVGTRPSQVRTAA